MNFLSRTQPIRTNPLRGRAGNKQYQQVQLALHPRTMSSYLKKALSPSPACDVEAPGSEGRRSDRAYRAESELGACHILDMKYEPEQYCSILYQLGEQMVVGTFKWDETNHPLPQAGRSGAKTPETTSEGEASLGENLLSGLHVYHFWQDPALSSLPIALDPKALVPILNEALPMCQSGAARVLRCRVTPVRYRPGKRCTLHFDLWLRDLKTGTFISRPLFGKIYHKLSKAQSVYEEMQMLSKAAIARNGHIALAKAVAFLPDLKMVLQEPIKGVSLDMLIGHPEGVAVEDASRRSEAFRGDSRGWRGVQQAAIALATLHKTSLTSKRERPIVKELARFKHRAAGAATVDATLGARLGELAAALPAWLGDLADWGAEVGLVHGDCKPSQFLIDGEQVTLLDFDHCGMADQASDVGTFMAKLRQLRVQHLAPPLSGASSREHLRQSFKAPPQPSSIQGAERGNEAKIPPSATEGRLGGPTDRADAHAYWLYALEQRFLDEYCIAGGHGPEFRLRATWYEAVALLRKALRCFARSPRSFVPSALVDEAWRCLTELPSTTDIIPY